jgi:hypothetical protein
MSDLAYLGTVGSQGLDGDPQGQLESGVESHFSGHRVCFTDKALRSVDAFFEQRQTFSESLISAKQRRERLTRELRVTSSQQQQI